MKVFRDSPTFGDPPEEGVTADTAPRSAADAVRRAVRAAESELWRPVSATELRWWADAPAKWEIVAGRLERDRIGQVLSDTARADRAMADDLGRLKEVRTPYTCHGGPPVRYWTQDPGEPGETLCRLLDLCEAVRPADEVMNLAQLHDRNLRLRREILREIWSDRGDMLVTLVEDARGGWPIEQVEHWIRRGVGATREWLERADLTADQRESRLAQWSAGARNLEYLLGVLEWPYVVGPTRPRTVGASASIRLNELEPLLTLGARDLGIRGRRSRQGIVAKARRVPLPIVNAAERMASPADAPLSAVDRVDALLAIWELFPVPAAHMLLDSAHAVLGHVLRDADIVLEYLGRAPEGDTWSRHALTVAAGLLGKAPDAGAVMREPGVYDDAAAWVFASVLSDWSNAADRIRSQDRGFRGGAARVTETAVRRLEAGHPFSVIG